MPRVEAAPEAEAEAEETARQDPPRDRRQERSQQRQANRENRQSDRRKRREQFWQNLEGSYDARAEQQDTGFSADDESQRAQQARHDHQRKKAEAEVSRQAAQGNRGAQLKQGSDAARNQYMESLRTSGILDPKKSAPKKRHEMSDLHRAYASMMVMQCITPLHQGMSPANVMRSAVMAGGMFAMSKNFRAVTYDLGDNLRDVIRNRKDAVMEKTGQRARGKLDATAEAKGMTAEELGLTGGRYTKWKKQADKYEHMERGHRELFTEESAALTEVGLAEAAYDDMRAPGADPEEVMIQYQQALGILYDYVEADGLDRAEVSKNSRIIIGDRMNQDPEFALKFNDISHGLLVKSDPRMTTVSGTGEQKEVWSGQFRDAYNNFEVNQGSFRVRTPMDQNDHMAEISNVIAEDLKAPDIGSLNRSLMSYTGGLAIAKYPETVEMVDDNDRYKRIQLMFSSMSDDGLSEDQQRDAYMAGMIDAVEAKQMEDPEFAASWNEVYGADWQQSFREEMKKMEVLGEEIRNAPNRHDASERTGEKSEHFTVSGEDVLDPDEAVPAEQEEEVIDVEIVEDDEFADVGDVDSVPVSFEAEEAGSPFDASERLSRWMQHRFEDSWNQRGPEAFEDLSEQLRVQRIDTSDDALGRHMHNSFESLKQQGFNDRAIDAMYADATVRAISEASEHSPGMAEHMESTWGPYWKQGEYAARVENPSAFVPPTLRDSMSAEDSQRVMVNAMSASHSGSYMQAQRDVLDADAEVLDTVSQFSPEGLIDRHRKLRTGAATVTMFETAAGAPIVDDFSYDMTAARQAEMSRAMEKAGISADDQNSLSAASYVQSLEQTSLHSPAVATATAQLYGNRVNWQEEAFRSADRTKADQDVSQRYWERKEALGLTGSDTAYSRAEERLRSAMTDPPATAFRQEMDANRQRQQRRRDNMYHNENEVISGRWAESSAQYGDDEPEMGG